MPEFLCQSAAELLLFVQKSKMAAADILDFIFVLYFGIRACRTSNVIHLPNLVKICAIVNKLWTIDEIQNGSRHHLEFIIFVYFGQMVCKISFIYVNRRLSYCCLCKNSRWWPQPSWILFYLCLYFGMHVCGTSNVVHMPNFVQIRAIINKLWAIN